MTAFVGDHEYTYRPDFFKARVIRHIALVLGSKTIEINDIDYE